MSHVSTTTVAPKQLAPASGMRPVSCQWKSRTTPAPGTNAS
jgi:hypothetical protein